MKTLTTLRTLKSFAARFLCTGAFGISMRLMRSMKFTGAYATAFVVGVILCHVSLSRAYAGSQQLYLEALLDFERYAETIWTDCSGAAQPPDSGYWGDGGSSGNGGIRGNCGVAVAYAALILAQPDNPTNTLRLNRVRKALNYASETHTTGAYVCVDGKRWGWPTNDWQTPEWAGSLGLACLLVESSLPAGTVQAVKRVVADEATHRALIPPASGYVSDTKLEENAWQGNILALAAAWLKDHTNAGLWLDAAKRYLVNTYTVPYATGDPLDAWVTTQTLYADWGCENHGIYHPTYLMVGGMSSGDSLLMAYLADAAVGAELGPFAEYNVMNVWSNNLQFMLMDSGELAYPSSSTWTLHDYEHSSYLAWIASHFGNPLARYADLRLAQLIREQQKVWGDGRFCGARVPTGFYREAVEARRAAIAWLHWANARYPAGESAEPDEAVVHFPDVKVIAHRSRSGFVSVYYHSARPMGWIECASAGFPTNVFVTSPYLRGVFGHGPMGNATGISLVDVVTGPGWFAAQLLVEHGTNGLTKVYLRSTGESLGLVEVPLPAPGVSGSSAGCFTNGIQNDPLTGGSRLIEWTGRSTNIVAGAGTRVNITNHWVCVSGRFGMAAGPAGYFRYRGATDYDSTIHIMQDTLCFQPSPATYRLAPRYAVWFLGKNASQTAALASQIVWRTNGANVELIFPGPTGSVHQVVASVVSGNGTWAVDADGLWGASNNWVSGAVADGAGFTADFSKVNITADRTVWLDSPRAIGRLIFGDVAGEQNWFLAPTNDGAIALGGSSPCIQVTNNTATITASLAGAGGFTKLGPGRLVLAGTNTISGIVNLDAGTTTGLGDGSVCLAHPRAVGAIRQFVIRNNTGTANGSTLQLDGGQGTIVVTQQLNFACRNNLIPNLQNLAGSNLVTSGIDMQVGGSNVVIRSDAGTLVLAGLLRYVGSYTTGRGWSFTGDGDIVVTGPILAAGNGAPISVAKFGTGTLVLAGTNTYTAETTVYDGALQVDGVVSGTCVRVFGKLTGAGIINAPVWIAPAAVLEVQGQPGVFTITGPLTNQGTIRLKLYRADGVITNDLVRGVTEAVLSGTLELVECAGPLHFGDAFKLIAADSYTGSFSSVSPPVPGPCLVWDTSRLNTEGLLSVGLGAVQPVIERVEFVRDGVVLTGTIGAAGAPFTVLAHTNVAAPVTEWWAVGSGHCDSSGRFNWTNAVADGVPQQFYLMRVP